MPRPPWIWTMQPERAQAAISAPVARILAIFYSRISIESSAYFTPKSPDIPRLTELPGLPVDPGQTCTFRATDSDLL